VPYAATQEAEIVPDPAKIATAVREVLRHA
jgi:hypothetical protein